ncbi:hypothetical protein HNY73_004661 [Argiope bruennichi]|uniref:Uncharacterized protein n=1 Tax=Argiope bruennichi TaxID=94029 RepID=A0A8T0FTZ5_ARGBR|nr:hypothetical protein HNY73_004661 [Argiope bruennichi]
MILKYILIPRPLHRFWNNSADIFFLRKRKNNKQPKRNSVISCEDLLRRRQLEIKRITSGNIDQFSKNSFNSQNEKC